MSFKKKPKQYRKATDSMLLNNPNSGVPLAHNAAGLKIFFSPRGFDFSSKVYTPDRGNFKLQKAVPITGLPLADTYGKITADELLEYNAVGGQMVTGSFPAIPATSDALFIMSGRHTYDSMPVAGEFPTMTFRPGSSKATLTSNKANIRIRVYPNAIGDQMKDSLGNLIAGTAYAREYKIDAPSTTGIDPNNYIVIAALDRTTNLWKMRGYRGSTQIHSVDNDISSAGFEAFNFKTTDDTSDLDNSAMTMNGVIAGYSMHVFDNGLPADWENAALLMGLAWQKQNYTFWNNWGTE